MIDHLKVQDYPISPPPSSKIMRLNSYRAKSPSSVAASSSSSSVTVSPSPSPKSPGSPRRHRSKSDLSEANSNLSLSNYSIDSSSTEYSNSKQEDFLKILEPNPVFPPTYSSLPPGGCPKFPVSEIFEDESLPDYRPSVYKVGVVSRKIEWVNPYEPATSRSWKNYIIELNSTQLNLYAIPSNWEPHILSFESNEAIRSKDLDPHFVSMNSLVTTEHDYQFLQFLNKLKFQRRLVRSYSLQHCKVGLAADYKKKNNVLRVRIESEQLLFCFLTTRDLIDWNLGLDVGKDLSLDLIDRELPKYRTVPRRRRRRNTEPLSYFIGTEGRLRSNSEPLALLSKMGRLKLKFKGDKLDTDSLMEPHIMTPPVQPQEEEEEDEPDQLYDIHSDDDDDDTDPEIQRLKERTRINNSKWIPKNEPLTTKKYYKNCLKCIKPLNFDDSWVSKSLVKPTNFSGVFPLSQSLTNLKKSDDLSRFPAHFVKEFVVGAHGLVPRELC